MQVFINIGELLTLSGVVKKQGRKPELNDLGIIKNAVLVTDRGKVLWTGTKAQYQKQKKNQVEGWVDPVFQFRYEYPCSFSLTPVLFFYGFTKRRQFLLALHT